MAWIPAVALLVAGCGRSSSAPVAQPADPSIYNDLKMQMGEKLQALVDERGENAGLCIAVVDGQTLVWAEAFGYADGPSQAPSTVDTIYRVGALSMPVTAAAVMRMADLGQVNIDQPVSKYLPEFAIGSRFPDAPPVTPRHIMDHHSGIPSDYFKGMSRDVAMPETQLVAALKDEWLTSSPGIIYSYSDVGYGVLGAMVAQVSGQSFPTYMRQNVLAPLGMKTAFFEPVKDIQSLLAEDYKKDGEPVEDLPTRDLAASGLYASVADMAGFMQMVFADGQVGRDRFLRPQTLAETVSPQNADAACDNGLDLGLGWMLTWPGLEYMGRLAWRYGESGHCNGFMMLALDHKLGIVVLSHGGATLRHVTRETLQLAVQAKAGLAPPPPEERPSSPLPIPQTLLDGLPGFYSTFLGFSEVRRAGEKLLLKAHGYTANMALQPDGRFMLHYLLAGIIPIPIPGLDDFRMSFYAVGDDQFVQLHEGPKTTIGERIPPVPIPYAWVLRQGHYEVLNIDGDTEYLTALDVSIRDGYLVLGIALSLVENEVFDALMLPVSETEAVIAGRGQRQGDRVASYVLGGRDRLRYSGYEFEKRP